MPVKYTGRIYKRGPGNYEAIVNFKDDELRIMSTESISTVESADKHRFLKQCYSTIITINFCLNTIGKNANR